jgi:hypothetical protein
MAQKPTGKIGPFTITQGPLGSSGGWKQIKFPEKKEGIEQLIFDFWVAEIRKAGGKIKSFRRNGENDFDFTVNRYAKQICDSVMRKSDHYGRPGANPIHLLMYITHWRFWPVEIVIRLVQYFLNKRRPIMENVFLVLPLDASTGTARLLFPSCDPLEGHDPSEFEQYEYLLPNPGKAEFVSRS